MIVVQLRERGRNTASVNASIAVQSTSHLDTAFCWLRNRPQHVRFRLRLQKTACTSSSDPLSMFMQELYLYHNLLQHSALKQQGLSPEVQARHSHRPAKNQTDGHQRKVLPPVHLSHQGMLKP